MINSVQFSDVKKQNYKAKAKALAGATAGTLVSLAVIMKKQNIKNPLKINYGLKDMLIMSGASICSGTASGMIGENKETKHQKLREGVFQFLNSSLPTLCVAGILKILNKHKNLNNTFCKVTGVISGIGIGMIGAAKISNKILDPKDMHPDRKLKLKDCIASIDDAVGALTLAKFPFAQNIKLDKALPIIYTYCGFRAGNNTSNNK